MISIFHSSPSEHTIWGVPLMTMQRWRCEAEPDGVVRFWKQPRPRIGGDVTGGAESRAWFQAELEGSEVGGVGRRLQKSRAVNWMWVWVIGRSATVLLKRA